MDLSILSELLTPGVLLGAAGVVLVIALLAMLSGRRAGRRRSDRRRAQAAQASRAPHDAAEAQPRLVTYPMPVVDVAEARLLEQLQDVVARSGTEARVLPQMTLSAFLYNGMKGLSRAQEHRAAALLASRQVDFLVVDAAWNPVAAVSLERDPLAAGEDDGVEAGACETAGIPFYWATTHGLPEVDLEEIGLRVSGAASIAAQ
jgi:hypothetical protein